MPIELNNPIEEMVYKKQPINKILAGLCIILIIFIGLIFGEIIKAGGNDEKIDNEDLIVGDVWNPTIPVFEDLELSEGSLIVGDASGLGSELTIGSNGYILTSNGTTANWQVNNAVPFAWTDETYGISTTSVTAFLNGSMSMTSTTIIGPLRHDGNATTTGSHYVGSDITAGNNIITSSGKGIYNSGNLSFGQLGIDSRKITFSSNNRYLYPNSDSQIELGRSDIYWKNTYSDTLYLNSTAIFSGSTAGVAALTGDLTVSGNATSTNYLAVGSSLCTNLDYSGGDMCVGDDLEVLGDTTVADITIVNQTITGNSTTTGYSSVGSDDGNFNFGAGDGNFADQLYVGGTSILTGNATFTNHFEADGSFYVKDGNVGIGTDSPSAELYINQATDGTVLKISTAGTEKLALNTNADNSWTLFDNVGGSWNSGITQSSGNVGIGTTTPWAQLSVEGQGSGPGLVVSDTSNNTDFIVDSAGNVGIGTVSPDTLLHINKSQSAATTLKIENTNGTSPASAKLELKGATNRYGIISFSDTTADVGQIYYYFNDDDMFFRTAGTNQMVIDSSGNVGIATTTPDSLLTVDGTFAVGTNGTEFTVNSNGSATTTDSLYVETERVYGDPDRSFTIASSTSKYISANTSTIPIDYNSRAKTISDIYCITDAGTVTIRIGDGTNYSEYLTCDTDGESLTPPANNTYTAREAMKGEFGNWGATANFVTVNINENYD